MKNQLKFLKSRFESLTESKAGTLIGGFSNALTAKENVNNRAINGGCSNNCKGGNCVEKCGG